MKKKILLSLLLAGYGVLSAQTNLVTNPGFESWTDNKPDGWSYSTSLIPLIETGIVKTGGSALRFEASATTNFFQNISITAGQTYELSFDYYIISGDGTDVRIWSAFKNSSTNTTMLSADMTTLNLTNKLRGPNGGYFPNVTGDWQHYSTSFLAPDGYDQFVFQINLYSTSKSVWDNFYFGVATASGVDNARVVKPDFSVRNGLLIAGASYEGKDVTICNVQGSTVLFAKVSGGQISLQNLAAGVYIAHLEGATQKIIVK